VIEKVTQGSWRTTAVGALGAVAILIHQAVALFDDDPLTKLNPDAIMTALGILGVGIFARDNKVSSETAGAK
jgi:hypothetical protein